MKESDLDVFDGEGHTRGRLSEDRIYCLGYFAADNDLHHSSTPSEKNIQVAQKKKPGEGNK